MNKKIPIPLKYILLFLLLFSTSVFLLFKKKKQKNKITTTTTTTTVKVKKKKDSIEVNYLKAKPVEVFKIVNTSDKNIHTVDKIYKPIKLLKKDTTKNNCSYNTLNKYKDTIRLKNGTIYASIFTTGRLFKSRFKLKTFDSIIHTKTNTLEKKEVVQNAFFLNYERQYALFPETMLVGQQISVDYTVKNKFRFGSGIGNYNVINSKKKYFLSFKIGIKL